MKVFPNILGLPLLVVGGVFSIPVEVFVAMDLAGVFSNELHDIDFSTSRPADLRHVGSESPNGGPDSPTFGQLGADFDFSKLPGGQALGVEAGRGVIDLWELFGRFVREVGSFR